MCSEHISRRFPAQARSVTNARKHGRLGHSFLIVSDVERNRNEFAHFLAAAACCTRPEADGSACGRCPQCLKLSNGSYEELTELFPTGKMRQIQVGDAANPEPDTLRWFDERLFLTGVAGRKIGIIHDADRLNEKSQNALLKTLEEPPDDCVIMLLTANPAMLLATTRSRCQALTLLENRCAFDFSGAAELFAILHRLWFAPERGLALGAACAAVILTLAAKLKDEAENATEAEWLPRLARAKELELPASAIKDIEKKQESQAAGLYGKHRKAFLESIYTFAAQLTMLAAGAAMGDLANPELFDHLPLPANFDLAQTDRFCECAAELLGNFNYMINEELSVRTFTLEVALAAPAGKLPASEFAPFSGL